jgi:hypothetical protein
MCTYINTWSFFWKEKNAKFEKFLAKDPDVATLALGSQPKQGLVKVWVDNEARESHFMLPGV